MGAINNNKNVINYVYDYDYNNGGNASPSDNVLPLIESIKVTDVEANDTLNRVTIRNDYYTVKNIVDQYYYALCNLNKTTDDITIFENDGSVGNLEEIVSQEKEATKKRIYNF